MRPNGREAVTYLGLPQKGYASVNRGQQSGGDRDSLLVLGVNVSLCLIVLTAVGWLALAGYPFARWALAYSGGIIMGWVLSLIVGRHRGQLRKPLRIAAMAAYTALLLCVPVLAYSSFPGWLGSESGRSGLGSPWLVWLALWFGFVNGVPIVLLSKKLRTGPR